MTQPKFSYTPKVALIRSEKFWNRVAKTYAKSPVADQAMYRRKLIDTRNLLRPNMKILEFGCGTGTTAIHHAPHVQQICAIDISERMLNIARHKAQEAGVENVKFVQGTLPNLTVDSASFDVVLGLNVIHLMLNWRDVLSDVERILKPGGVFVSSTECLGHSFRRFATLITPLGSRLGIMPNIAVITEAELGSEISGTGLEINRQWRHGKNGAIVFTIAKKSVEVERVHTSQKDA